MHVEATRILTEWLKDTEFGVNALLAAIPRKRANGTNDPKPGRVDIYNDVDFDILRDSGLVPPTMPSLVIVSEVTAVTDDFLKKQNSPGHVMRGAAGVAFYAEQTEPNKDVIAGNYVLRAVKQSLNRFNKADQRRRQLNSVLIAVTKVEIERVASAVPAIHMLGILFAELFVLDKAP